MKIIFVRHANDKNDRLTCLGVKQAKLVVEELKYENICAVYSSPMRRTFDTAKIIARKLNHDILIDSRIAERELDKSHMTDDQIKEFDDNYLNPKYSHFNPEGCKEFLDRVYSFLDEIIAKHDDGSDISVLIVGHSSLSYAIYSYFYGASNPLVWTRVGNASKLAFETKSIK